MKGKLLIPFIAVLIIKPLSVYANPLDFWTWRNPYPTGISISRVVYENGNYIGVGWDGTVITSPDGTNWVQRYSATSEALRGVAYGHETYVAVGGTSGGSVQTYPDQIVNLYSSSGIFTSPDCISWTRRDPATSNSLVNVAFGNGLFVAVGGNASDYDFTAGKFLYTGTVQTSSDGIIWTERFSGTNQITAVAYGNGKFVAVGTGGATFSSPDGINWTQQTVTNIDSFSAIAYGNGLFVVLGDYYDSGTHTTTRSIITSPDGDTWTEAYRTYYYHRVWLSDGGGDSFGSIIYANGQFTVVGAGDYYIWMYGDTWYWNFVLTSSDGSNWSYQREDGMNPWRNINTMAYHNGQYLAAAWNQIFTSQDVRTWTQQSYDVTAANGIGLSSVTFGGDQFVAVGQRYDRVAQQYVGAVLTSPRGMSWTERETTTNNLSWCGVTYGNGRYIAVGNPGSILSSTNGFCWNLLLSGTGDYLRGIAYGNGSFVAVGSHYDYDPVSGTQTNRGIILTSHDSINWSRQIQPSDGTYDYLNGVAFGGGQFVAVGYHYDSSTYQYAGMIFTSGDGVNWVMRYSGTNGLQAVTYGNGRFIAVGWYGEILTSPDGISWSHQSVDDYSGSISLSTIAYGNGAFVAAADYSDDYWWYPALLTSSDGENWTMRRVSTYLSAVAYGAGNFVAVGGNSILQSGDLNALNPSPVIFAQPANQRVPAGASAKFTVSADGMPLLHYQWRLNEQNILGGTNALLTVDFVTTNDVGRYSVIVWNGYGSVTSSVAHLTTPDMVLILPTDRDATMAETTAAYIQPTSLLKVFEGGMFTANPIFPVNRDRMTVVLTHGWNSNPNEWATNLASLISTHSGANPPNIVTWDWTENSASLCSVAKVAEKTQTEGPRLGLALLNLLGSDYTQRVHYIGHSLGTLVNAYAADYLDEQVSKGPGAWLPSNVHVTLFDEAEVGSDVGCLRLFGETLFWGSCSYFGAEDYKHHPLPRHFAWADNYITAFGKLQTNATNIILTHKFPDIQTWRDIKPQAIAYHSYPMEWYASSILSPGDTPMGFGKSFEYGGLTQFPSTSTIFMQSGTGLSLGEKTQVEAEAWQAQRCEKYFSYRQWYDPPYVTTPALPANMSVNGWTTTYQFGESNFLYIFHPTTGTQQLERNLALTAGVNTASTSNAAGYAWIPLDVPTNATTLAFDFMLEGDGMEDSFAVAINGTNVFSVAASLIETGKFVSTGPIDVSEFAGQTIELFLGLVGGTSTNVTVSVQNMTFYSPLPPVANFTAMPAAGTVPLTVSFTDGSSGMITNWFWDFGDGNTTNMPDPEVAHTYSVISSNTVSLIVSGPTGSSTNTVLNLIWALNADQLWQFQYFGCVDCPQAADDADPDGDGMSNLKERLAGTTPTNATSTFKVGESARTAEGFTIIWQSVPGKTYQVLYADSPGGPWEDDLPQVTAGTGETTLSYTDATIGAATKRFYRVKLVQ